MSDFEDRLSGLMAQIPMIQQRVADAKERASAGTAEGSAGGGIVKVTANGEHRLVSLKIDPTAMEPPDLELLEDLIVAAVTQAQASVTARLQDEMSTALGGLPLGDISSLLPG